MSQFDTTHRIHRGKRVYLYPSLTLSMTDRDVVERFWRVVGVGSVWGPITKQGDRKPQWRWYVRHFEDVQALMERLLPYLHKRRREQYRAVVAKRGRQAA